MHTRVTRFGWQPDSQPSSHRSHFITQFLQSFVTDGFLEHHRLLWRFRDTDGIINYRWANPDFLCASRYYFVALWLGLGRRPPLSTQSSRTCTVVTLEQRSEIIHLEWPWGPTDTALLLGPASPVMRSWTIVQRTLAQLALPHRETFQNLFQNCHPLIKHHHVPGASHGASKSTHDSDCPADEAVAPTSICLPGYTYGNDARYAIVRCLWCGLPYHKKCVSVDVYTCQSCRLLPQQICTMSQNILDLSRTIQALTDENVIMRDKLDVQTRTISSLESRVSKLVSAKLAATTSPAPVLDALVMGSSDLRDLDATKLQSTTIDCIRGGKIPDVHQKIKNKKNKYSSVFIIVGGNDCAAAVDASPVDELLHNYKCLVDDAKSLSEDIRVATILPRDDCQETTDRIDALNAGLVEMCASSGLALVNNDDSFKLKDGSINDGYFLRDGTHLTKCGTNRLAKNLKLATKQQYTKRCYALVCRSRQAKSGRVRWSWW